MHAATSMVCPTKSKALPARETSFRPGQEFVGRLLDSSVLLPEDWEALPSDLQDDIALRSDSHEILEALVQRGLLTQYQADRVRSGTTYGLVLGNYRVLDRLGAGGMAVVFKAEHIEMRRTVAVKVLPHESSQHSPMISRFIAEMRTIAQLQHPNIVAAFDAGRTTPPDPDSPVLRYIVMEYVPGQTLEDLVQDCGPLAPIKACDIIHQIANALAEANKLGLVHRDIKPSNILVTPEGQAKLLDFGLVHQLGNNLTEAGAILGTVDYMAPEQCEDASNVDIRADLYGLGGTLYWCLTGLAPFSTGGRLQESLYRRLTQPPPSVRAVRPEIDVDLEAVVDRLMAPVPADRFADPKELMRALLPFLRTESRDDLFSDSELQDLAATQSTPHRQSLGSKTHRVLIVDDEEIVRSFCRLILRAENIECFEASDGRAALVALQERPCDLVLMDNHMPGMTGLEVLRCLREAPPTPNLKVVMISGQSSSDEMANMLLAGADDYLTKPLSLAQLKNRVHAALRLKEAQDHSDLLNRHLLKVNAEIEQTLANRDSDLVHSRNALVLALAKLVEQRDTETGAHLARVQRYSRCLAEQAAKHPAFAGQIDRNGIEMIECCAPLHDIGKVALPDHILMKPGPLTADERLMMQAHTVIGANTLQEVADQHGGAVAFLQTAIEIARHHHERFDGKGYPDRLVGSGIPLSARIVAMADVYDALRSRRTYKPAMSHSVAVQMMAEASPGHFDPALVTVFTQCADRFDRIFREVPG
jgi:putative two-component system response regulator